MSGGSSRPLWQGALPWLTLGSLAAAIYVFIFVQPYALARYYATPLLDLTKISRATTASGLQWAAGWAILFALYYGGYRLCPGKPSRGTLVALAAFPLLFSLILLWMYPVGAADIFDYIFHGHLFAHYRANPLTTPPTAHPDDPLYAYVAFKGSAAPYGAVWGWWAALTSLIAGDDLWTNLLAYKLVAVGHFWAGMPLVYWAVRAWRPEEAARSLLLYAWNPLAQFEIAGNGHNEAMLIFWLLAAGYLLLRRRHVLALLALTAAILVKFVPLLLVPLFLAAVWQSHGARGARAPAERIGRVGLALAAMGCLAALLYLPFGLDSARVSLTNNRGLFTASVPRLALFVLQDDWHLPEQTAQAIVRNLSLLLAGGAGLWQAARLLRLRDPGDDRIAEGVLSGSYEVLFFYLLVACLWFQPWYVTWLLAFAPLLPGRGYAARTALFCVTAVGNYFVWDYYFVRAGPDFRTVQTVAVWVIYPLPALLTVALWFQRRGAQRKG